MSKDFSFYQVLLYSKQWLQCCSQFYTVSSDGWDISFPVSSETCLYDCPLVFWQAVDLQVLEETFYFSLLRCHDFISGSFCPEQIWFLHLQLTPHTRKEQSPSATQKFHSNSFTLIKEISEFWQKESSGGLNQCILFVTDPILKWPCLLWAWLLNSSYQHFINIG